MVVPKGATIFCLFAWFKVSEANFTDGQTNTSAVSVSSTSYALGTFKITAVFEGLAENVKPTDEDGNTTYYLDWDSDHPTSHQVTKYAAGTDGWDEIDVKFTITYDGTGGSHSLTNAEIDAAYALAYANESNKEVHVTVTSTNRVKISKTSGPTAVAQTDPESTGIDIVIGNLPSTITGGTYTSAASAQHIYFGLIGDDVLDDADTEFGTIEGVTSLESGE